MRSKQNLIWIVLIALILTAAKPCAHGQSTHSQSIQSRQALYGQLPLAFEKNMGQANPAAQFLSRGREYSASLTAAGLVLSLRPSNSPLAPAPASTVQLVLEGASKNPAIVGENPLPGKINYFLGNDSSRWLTNVPTYASVRYKNVYPGIDLVYYGNHQEVEFDFDVAPGANAEQIRFRILGAKETQISANGDLVLSTSAGELQFLAPRVYQPSNGTRNSVSGGYALEDSAEIGFHLAKHDVSKPLVIDPVLVYSSFLGGSGNEQAGGVAVDANGDIYIAGSTDSTNFELSTLSPVAAGSPHVFVTKLDPTGSTMLFCDYFGGNAQDFGYALALDSNNHVYVTGSTGSSNFPVVNPYQPNFSGFFNAFVTELSADGASIIYSTYLGGNGTDTPAAIAVDGTGAMIIAGTTSSTNFPVAAAYQSSASANQGGLYGQYGFLTKLNPEGSSLVFSTYFAGSANVALNCGGTPCWPQPYSGISGLAIDAGGNAYVGGATNTSNFPTTEGAYMTANATSWNNPIGFAAKFTASGSLQYSTYFGDAFISQVNAIAVDASGSAYLTGIALNDGSFPITSTGICDPSVYNSACNYAFVSKLDNAGANLLYSTFLGPNNLATPQAIALDSSNDAYIFSSTSSTSFNPVNPIEGYSGSQDALLVEVDPSASTQLFATFLGGSSYDEASAGGIFVDQTGNVYLAGMTSSPDFPVTQGAEQTVPGGNNDVFVAKIGPASASSVVLNPSSLAFGTEDVGGTSQPQTVLLRNMGSAPLDISSIVATPNFTETDNCNGTVSAAGSCTLSISFAPVAAGSLAGSIVIEDNAIVSSSTIALSGSATGAVASLNESTLTFPNEPLSTTSASQVITLTNQGNAALSIANIQSTGNYSQTNNCPASLAAASSCSVSVTFTPTQTGSQAGTLSIQDSQGTQTVTISGVGVDFALAASSNNDTVKSGSTASYVVTVSSLGGNFSSNVQLSCAGVPSLASCSISPASLIPGQTSATATVTISTGGSSAQALSNISSRRPPVFFAWFELQGLGAFGIVLGGARAKKNKNAAIVMLLLAFAAMLLMVGCAGGTGIAHQNGGSGTASGTYTITVTGTSAGLQHSIPLTLTVQ